VGLLKKLETLKRKSVMAVKFAIRRKTNINFSLFGNRGCE